MHLASLQRTITTGKDSVVQSSKEMLLNDNIVIIISGFVAPNFERYYVVFECPLQAQRLILGERWCVRRKKTNRIQSAQSSKCGAAYERP